MKKLEPGTPKYRDSVRNRIIFIGSMFVLGILGAFGVIMLIYFDIPQSEPAKLLTAFLMICFGALCVVSLLGAASLLISSWAQARLVRLKNQQAA